MIEKVPFGSLKRGDRFALSEDPLRRKDDMYINMKVDSAVLCVDETQQHIPFNVIALGDGRVRTFRDEELVYVVKS